MCLPALTNTLLKNESMTVQFFFLNMLYGISYGFDITHDLLVRAWHFKDILRLVVLLFYRSIHVSYIMYTLYITWPGLD